MRPRSRFKHGDVRCWVIYLVLFFLAILFYFPPYHPETAEHDVFLSFSAVDVRYKFVSHLHAALLQNSIKVFIDDELGRESIEPALLNAIANSKLAIIIFSTNYASSTYCLEELVQLIECHAPRKTIIPIFYEVNPSDVGYQSGVFAEALAVHKEVLKHSEKVFRWRIALTIAANMARWVSENKKPEAELIREVVNDISGRLALHTSHIVWEKTRQVAACCLLFALPVVIFKWPADDDQSPEKPKHVSCMTVMFSLL